MRHFIWIAALVVLIQVMPMAYAQSDGGTKAGTYSGPAGAPPPGLKADPLQPSNCGTPDDPKPCGPMPRGHCQPIRDVDGCGNPGPWPTAKILGPDTGFR